MARRRNQGVSTVRAQLQAAPQRIREQVADAVGRSADETRAEALALIDARFERRSGALRRLYRVSKRRKSLQADVGYLTRAARRRAFYARFLHDGTETIAAYPFHDLAVDKVMRRHLRRMLRAAEAAFEPRKRLR